MSNERTVITLIQMSDSLARVVSFLEMFPQGAREAWLGDFRDHCVVSAAEVKLLEEYFGEVYAS